MTVALAGGTLISLGCVWAALSWIVPAYLLKPPPDDPDGEPKLTMPELTVGVIASLLLALVLFAIVVASVLGY